MDHSLQDHYRKLLGLEEPWEVKEVDLDLAGQRVEIELIHGKDRSLKCPECGQACPGYDEAPERRWRHLDTMRFETVLRARVPRVDCPECGVNTVAVPWAGKHSRFTLLFEAFAIEVISAAANLSKACALLNIDWDTAQRIMERAVERGLRRRGLEAVRYVGVDEKSFRKGHRYVSTLNDLEGGRVIEVVEGRDEQSARKLWESLPEAQREKIEGVALDMWQPFMAAAREASPQAALVHDRFHVSKHLNDALDQVRRREHKELTRQGDDTLKGSRYLWSYAEENLSDAQWERFEALKDAELKTSRAWAIKECFRWFWEPHHGRDSAAKYFKQWYGWAARSRLTPVKKVARMLKRHLEELLNWCDHRITNAVSEGLNSRIQSIKSAARGFHHFESYRVRILFHCGKLDLAPDFATH